MYFEDFQVPPESSELLKSQFCKKYKVLHHCNTPKNLVIRNVRWLRLELPGNPPIIFNLITVVGQSEISSKKLM